MEILNEIRNLKDGQCFIVSESDYGKAEIWKINDVYIVFSIPYMGGEPTYHDTYKRHDINVMIEEINNWS